MFRERSAARRLAQQGESFLARHEDESRVRFDTMSHATRWVGRIFLRPGRLLYVGAVGPSDLHSHHAFQIARGLSGPITFVGALGERLDVAAAVIPPDTLHATAGATASGWMMYVDPDGPIGRRLRRTTKASSSPQQWSERAHALRDLLEPLPQRWDEVDRLEVAVMKALAVPTTLPQPLHPAVGRALRAIGDNLGGDVSLATVAAIARLSAGRLSHVFAAEIGIPMRRYVLWQRLMRAAIEVQAGGSWTDAAHAGGFTDSPHMNHTFRRMFGLAPTDVHRAVEWVVGAEGLARSAP